MIRTIGWVAVVYAVVVAAAYGYACWHFSPEAWSFVRDTCQRIAFHVGRAGMFAEKRVNELEEVIRG